METKTAMGCTNIWTPIQEIQFEAKNAILVNLVDINVLMLLWANLSRHLDRCILRLLRRVISFHLLVNRVRLHAVLVTIKHPTLNLPVMLLMQATMFLAQPNRARLLVLLEPSAARQARVRVQTLLQDMLCHLLVSRVRLHAVLVTIKHHPVKLPVMLLMQATMFLALVPKRSQTACAAGTYQSKHWVQSSDDACTAYCLCCWNSNPNESRLLGAAGTYPPIQHRTILV